MEKENDIFKKLGEITNPNISFDFERTEVINLKSTFSSKYDAEQHLGILIRCCLEYDIDYWKRVLIELKKEESW
jgi:hypothetical protein